MIGCNSCGIGYCPVCSGRRGVVPDMHSGHRVPLQDLRCPQQGGPIPSDTVDRAPTERLGPDEISGTASNYRVSNIVHAPEAIGARLADVPNIQSTPPKNE